MPVLGINDGKPFWIYTGYRVDQRGRHNKWQECGLYCLREAAQRAIDHLYGHNRAGKPLECRIVEVSV